MDELSEEALKYPCIKSIIELCVMFDREKRPSFGALVAKLEGFAKQLPKIVRCQSDPCVFTQSKNY